MVGRPGRLPAVVGQLRSRRGSPRRRARASRVIGRGVHVAEDQVRVVGSACVTIVWWSALPGGGSRVRPGARRAAQLRSYGGVPALEQGAQPDGSASGPWRRPSCRRPCSPARRPGRAAGPRAPPPPSARELRGDLLGTSRSTSSRRTVSTSSWRLRRPRRGWRSSRSAVRAGCRAGLSPVRAARATRRASQRQRRDEGSHRSGAVGPATHVRRASSTAPERARPAAPAG